MSFDWKYYRGDIYYADLNPVCGCEQGGKRPVVIQNDTGNLFSTTLIVAMVTTKQFKKQNFWFYDIKICFLIILNQNYFYINVIL